MHIDTLDVVSKFKLSNIKSLNIQIYKFSIMESLVRYTYLYESKEAQI